MEFTMSPSTIMDVSPVAFSLVVTHTTQSSKYTNILVPLDIRGGRAAGMH